MALLEFSDIDERDGFLQDGGVWLGNWFSNVQAWKPEDVSRSRFVWLRCEGVPLHAWNPNFFKLLGNFWGTFISLDANTSKKIRFDVGRVLCLTQEPEAIVRTVHVAIDGKMFNIRLVEEPAAEFLALASGLQVKHKGNSAVNGVYGYVLTASLNCFICFKQLRQRFNLLLVR